MSTPARAAREGKRQKTVREQVLRIVHGTELAALAFAALAMWGVTRDWPAPVAVLGVMALIAAGLFVLRYPWGWIVSLVGQLAMLALGFVDPLMFITGLAFFAMWLFCMRKVRQVEARSS